MSASHESANRQADLPAFLVIGIEARTDNRREMGPDGIIPRQWQRFFQEGMAEKIPNKIGSTLYAVYSLYTSDRHGEYSFLIGAKVKEGTTAPAGMMAKAIAAGRYRIFTSQTGPLETVVPLVWQTVWGLEVQGSLKRAYRVDFEVYDERGRDPQNPQVELWVSVLP